MSVDAVTAEYLVNEYGSALYGFCRKLTRNTADADDLYQQTFLRLLVMPAAIDLDHNPRGFLMAVAVRLWHDSQRKCARRDRIAPVHAGKDVDSVADQTRASDDWAVRERQNDVQAAVGDLPDKLRVPVLLYFLVGRPHTEVICPHCGARTDGSKPYCANCGEPLTGVAPTVQPVAKWPLIVGLVCFALPIVYMIVIAGILMFVPRFH
ncbi:sigma-70 family RNA polymerase sigma factor [Schleiferilactobacillus shenzhenensis]|uniref:RNA polymerase sigma-70 region 2 domain-containing protein n=1 Tax=Schleiferilactobacillus shenzhenensis LY-73 TaxID=1231336 RepID=U4TKW1_9LACO|nr:sigma-70 family RNA polymerase sigma factor [Schleiferilactobacillus shenzhenensis]ERL65491.1 hypothetical protein L248_2564 [Schleiferilactobacillus shenzhenensis LY-73]